MTTGRRPGPSGGCGQSGSASLLVVTLSGVVLLVGLAAAFVTATAAAHRRAQSAADLAALAGAVARQRGEDACGGAADVARGNGAELTACEVLGDRGRALDFLQQAFHQGFSTSEPAREPDLLALRGDPRYQRLLSQPGG